MLEDHKLDKSTPVPLYFQLKSLLLEEIKKNEYPGLIPRDWTLQRVLSDGSLEVVQRGVLDYLPLGDGGYIYSNGAHVFRVDASGARSHLFKAHLATDFILLDE